MGIADLRGPFAKLGRAEEHLGILNEEVRAFVGQESKPTLIECRYEQGWYVLYLNSLPLSQRVALIAGDYLNNVRAALDHLVWQLVLREGQVPRQANRFPIYDCRQEFINQVETPAQRGRGHALCGIPINGDAWAVIEGAQPYHCGPQKVAKYAALAMLAYFNNADKHRVLLAQRWFLDPWRIPDHVRWRSDLQPSERHVSWGLPSPGQPAEIARFRFPPGVDPRMQVEGVPRIGPVIGDDTAFMGMEMVATILREARHVVEQVAALPRVQGRKEGGED